MTGSCQCLCAWNHPDKPVCTTVAEHRFSFRVEGTTTPRDAAMCAACAVASLAARKIEAPEQG